MKEPSVYQKLLWWLEEQQARFVRWSTGHAVWYLGAHSKLDAKLLSLLPLQHHWLLAKHEWSICRTFNDGPDECYWPWRKFWKMYKDQWVGE